MKFQGAKLFHSCTVFKITAKGTKLILLLFTAGPLDITWAKYVDGVHAILVCYFPAQATGEALYSMLIGANGPVSVPAGRLTITWPANIEQVSRMFYLMYYIDKLIKMAKGQ